MNAKNKQQLMRVCDPPRMGMGISPVERTIPCNLKVPESPERGNTRFFAPMHDFIVTLEVGGEKTTSAFQ